jgi:CheY-like chemotaxis protein
MPTPLIYVVDDEAVIASTLALILERSGFTGLPFTNPLEALDSARLQAPDLLVTDVMMPQLSGVDLAIKIRETCPDCKVLLFSGQAATTDLLLSARERGYDFNVLSKPIHPTDLLRNIHALADVSVPLRFPNVASDCLRA